MDNFKQENIFNDDTKFCSLCNVAISSKITAHSHFNGRLHKSQVERMKTRERQAEKGIFIRRDDMSTIADEELISIFKKYGEVLQIRRVGPNKPFCVLKFADGASVQRALSEPIYHRGKILQCSQEKPFGARLHMKLTTKIPPSKPKNQRTSTPPSHELINIEELPINNDTSFEDAVNEFIKEIEAPPGLEEKHKLVCADLEQTFAAELPGVKARLFGSTITGLAFKDSDLDIFMECPDGQPGRTFVAKRTDCIFKIGLFRNIIKISHARVPIVKCIHIWTGISCDVTFISKLGVVNSQLIRFYLSLDERLRPMCMLIKYWARVHDITGPGKFSNYSLVMFTICYLQQLSDPILPSVKLLQDICDSKELSSHLQMTWQSNFCDDKTKVPSIKNQMSLKELLLGFFCYFSEFNFKEFVLSPFLGRPVRKEYFKDIDDKQLSELPEDVHQFVKKIKEFPDDEKFMINAFCCLQDPLHLSFNITKCVTYKLHYRFKWLCDYSKNHIETTNMNGLFKLLFSLPAINEPKVLSSSDKAMISIPITSIYLPNTAEEERLTDDYKLSWFKCMKDAVLLVFEAIYKFKILPNDKTTRLLKSCRKLLPEEVYKNLNYHCYCKVPVFNKRKKSEKRLCLTKSNCLEREVKISDYIVSTNKERAVFCADIQLLCYPDLPTPALCISVTEAAKEKYNMFKSFTSWIESVIVDHCKLALKYNKEDKPLRDQPQKQMKMNCTPENTEMKDLEHSNDSMKPGNKMETDIVRKTGTSKNFKYERKKRRFPYTKHSANDHVFIPDPASLLLSAIEKPLQEDDWAQ